MLILCGYNCVSVDISAISAWDQSTSILLGYCRNNSVRRWHLRSAQRLKSRTIRLCCSIPFFATCDNKKKKRKRAVTASSEEVLVVLWVCSDDAPTASFAYPMKDLRLAAAEWPLLISAQKAASHTGQNPRFGRRTPELHHYLLALCLKLANNGGLTAKLLYMWLFRWRWWCCCGAQEQSGRVFA